MIASNYRRYEEIKTQAGKPFIIERTDGINLRFIPLVNKLVALGWDESWVREKFADNSTVFIPKLALTSFNKSKVLKENNSYSWMYTEESDSICKNFIEKYSKSLLNAERIYGVNPEVISALLWCETRHGKVTGDYPILSSFASMAMMSHPTCLLKSIKNTNQYLDSIGVDSIERHEVINKIRERSITKSNWAFEEIKALLTIEKNGSIDILQLKSSWAGAFGWAQFLPSSYLKFSSDGNGDKKVNLFNPSDAIFSVANYLNRSGYIEGNMVAVRRALRNYNRSYDYSNAIANLAERILPIKDDNSTPDSSSQVINNHPAVTGNKTSQQPITIPE